MPKKIDYIFLLRVLLIEVVVTVTSMFMFSGILYFLEGGYQFSPLFATISLGIGCLASAFYVSKKTGKNGLLNGSIVGGITLVLVILIGLMVSKDIFSLNTLFKVIIIMLLSFIGGVLGVNSKQNQKYI